MGKLFGTDGIRGEANRYPMDGIMAFQFGQAITHIIRKSRDNPKIVIGRDTRVSGLMLERALEAGITSMGGNAYDLGVLPTPGVAFVAKNMGFDAGIVISASHNPYQDNGIKAFNADGFKLSDEKENQIEDLILNNELADLAPPSRQIGSVEVLKNASKSYISFLKDTFPDDLSMNMIKIVLDTANGAAFEIAPRVFDDLGADVEIINNNPDGFNINDNCGSQYTAGLEKMVKDSGAAVGLAFDGDGDRLIAVDEKGCTLTGDQILIICARMLKRQGILKNNLLVSTVMSNLGLTVACKKYGFRHHTAKVGDRYVLEQMLSLNAVLGGEDSGHIIFLNHHTTGDGILAAIQLVAAMVRQGRALSELALQMNVFPQKLISVEVGTKPELSTVPEIENAIKDVETQLGDQGRVLVRYSGTQNLCRVMVEGPSDELTDQYCKKIAEVVKSALN
ncbi:Phosphoglucosamine mutase [uncultured Desulfobacterium sp.]|uniref:Phosphoglucosamine mutase n=1 Tax=uncultured Desulfobacterium sp. TaxID=201089 RepID=A0A445MUJ4_9BACT|nr:Phosphoglucosamine mutase [uncultured Desulfobacterium sp.]